MTFPRPGSAPATSSGGPDLLDTRAASGPESAALPLGALDPELLFAGPRGASHPDTPASSTSGFQPRLPRMTIGMKLGALIAALLAALVCLPGVLVAQSRATGEIFEGIQSRDVRESLLARQMQVAFKQRVQEWKNILLRGSNPADLAEYGAKFEAEDRKTDDLYKQLLAMDLDPGARAQIQRFGDFERAADTAYDEALEKFVASGGRDFKTADRDVRGVDRPASDQIDRLVATLEAGSAKRIADQERLTREEQRITLIVAGALLVLLTGVLVFALVRIVRPIRRLTRQAEETATERLPEAIARLKTLEPGAETPVLPPFSVTTRDELRDLGKALTALQDSALAQAVEQHRVDRETSAMLLNLGRRNQNLLGRMLSYVTELERKEQDPEVLAQLFRLDHATTRIRRNAESMLVLAGATQTRTWSRPVPVVDVVRAALSEIEEYIRVDLHHIEDCLVNGSAVADVIHLIAELVENATHFSPPTTQVTVIGQRVREGYRIRVVDQGVGMTRRELEGANRRIRQSEGGRTDAKLLGLYVVGQLARRRGVEVVLEPSAGRGITASILLPESVLGAGASGAGARSAASALLDSTAGSTKAAPAPTGPSSGERVRPDRVAPAPAPDAPTPAPASGPMAPPTPPVPTPPVPATSGPTPSPPAEVRTARQPSPTNPAAVTQPGSEDPNRIIDLTDPGPTRRDPQPTAGVPVQWFNPEPDRAPKAPERPGQASANGATSTPRKGLPSPTGAAIPRRVRGAQLPDLGPTSDPVIARPDDGPGAAESLRWQLRSFQLDVQAARRALSESGPAGGMPRGSGQPRPGSPGPEQSDQIHGHHPKGER